MAYLMFPVNDGFNTAVLEVTPAFLAMAAKADVLVAQDRDLVFVTRPWPVQIYVSEWCWHGAIVATKPCPSVQADRAVDPILSFWGDGHFDFVSDRYENDDSINIEWMEAKVCPL